MPHSEIVKGYEFDKGRYVVLSEEDFDKVRPESTRVIDLVQFADDSTIDPMFIDRAYYLAPDGPVAADAFAVMREGMKGKVGVGKLALYGREYLVAVKAAAARDRDVHAHHAAEIRGIEAVDELNSVPEKVKPEEIKLAKQVIETFEGPLDLATYKDEYREGLQQIIDAKIAGEEIVAPQVEAPAEGRQPDGRAEEEPRRRQYGKKKTAKAAAPKARSGRRAQTRLASKDSRSSFAWTTNVGRSSDTIIARAGERMPISAQPTTQYFPSVSRDWRGIAVQIAAGLAALTREMSFVEHLEELRRRLIWSVVFIGAAFGLCWIGAGDLYEFASAPIPPTPRSRSRSPVRRISSACT